MSSKILVIVTGNSRVKRETLKSYFPKSRYDVILASNGHETIDYAAKYKPDIVLSGVGIELIDGFSVCKYIKSDPATREVAVVVYTNEKDVDSILEALKVGADDYLIEPIDQELLLRKLDKVIATVCKKHDASDSRTDVRKIGRLTVTWRDEKAGNDDVSVSFKESILDISIRGMAFEHSSSADDSGYLEGSVHPNSEFFPYAYHIKNSKSLEFYITLPSNKIIQVRGKINYTHKLTGRQGSERVGVVFTEISKEAKAVLEEYLGLQR